MLTTLLPPTGGTATVAGCDLAADPAGVRRACGYVAQSGGVDPQITVREELVTQGRFYRLPKAVAAERAEELARDLDLADVLDRRCGELSGGRRRRLEIAMALTHRPKVLFLDEPTTGLDPGSRADLWELVRRLRDERGTTVFLTTHYLDEADALADRLVIVDRGVVVAEGTPAALKLEYGGSVDATLQDTFLAITGRGPAPAAPAPSPYRTPHAAARHRSRLRPLSAPVAALALRPALRRADAAAVPALLRAAPDRPAAGRAGQFLAGAGARTADATGAVRGLVRRLHDHPGEGPGVVERMRVTPVSRLALLLGRMLREATVFVFQAVLLVLAAVAMGLRAPLPGVLIGFAFVALLTVSLASLSYALAMKVATPQGFGPVINALTMPAMLLSGLMLPMTLGPRWLDVLSHLMPLRYLVDAVRDAYVGRYATTHMLYGALVAVGLTVLSVTVGTRVFRTAGA